MPQSNKNRSQREQFAPRSAPGQGGSFPPGSRQGGGARGRSGKFSSGGKQETDAKLLDLARVTRVAAGGRRFRFRAVVIWGDKKGKVGVGVAKGSDVAQAIEKATRQAKKSSILVPIVGGTIGHEVEAKFGASRILLRPQTGGRGLVAGGPVRIICEFAGIKNISGKFISKTHNKLNNALSAIEALRKLTIQDATTSNQTKS